ncbi:MAG: hypothetical protein ACRC1Z_16010 [Waterburya sp.]
MKKIVIALVLLQIFCPNVVKAEDVSVADSMRSFSNKVLDLCRLHSLNFKSSATYDYDKATYACKDFILNYDAAIQNITKTERSGSNRDFLLSLKDFDDLYAPVTQIITNTPSGFTRMIERDLMKYK